MTPWPGPASALAEHTWTELDETRPPVLLVPVGSCEQHGPHLPLDTDTRIATAVAEGAGGRHLLCPPIAYGSSGEHQAFPGTVSVGENAMRELLVELGRSACTWTRRLVFVNGHGGNLAALTAAVRLLRYEGRDTAWFPCAVSGSDPHAGASETALLLAIEPSAVRSSRLRPGNTEPLPELLPRLRQGALRTVSPTGVLGDPTAATAQDGARLLAAMRAALAAALRRWEPGPDGRLR
ncbi:mycofactocin biosynthesis peptidyl-dipeptidase MftE [Amycolatopsis antarctica]|uniref:Mycofactocin biosynthesis peptidyl-dipeptidase MftE n=1 Tax=Amycolatopsis antarctica TaxID=1854586 RepID=A0A263D0K3_9PSEU|nr:mycofactocin biosynthesis peptidyl-dipeptidase MftE [Amycolatopsis antarctica]OZM71658.1 mycofactocin biosynthesis peptidyl-dipeptidase MftE [Amycolatopsis antarctica]